MMALAPGAIPALAQDRLVPRVGAHETYDRAVLDWSGTVEYDVEVAGREIRVRFGQAAEIDTAPIMRRVGERATALRSTVGPDGTTLSFTLAPGTQLRHFRTNRGIVLDFVRSPDPEPVDPASTRRLAQERAARPQASRPPAAAPPVAAAPPAATAPPATPPRSAAPAAAPAAPSPSPAVPAVAAAPQPPPAGAAASPPAPAAAVPPPPPSVDPPMPRPIALAPSSIAAPAEIRAAAPAAAPNAAPEPDPSRLAGEPANGAPRAPAPATATEPGGSPPAAAGAAQPGAPAAAPRGAPASPSVGSPAAPPAEQAAPAAPVRPAPPAAAAPATGGLTVGPLPARMVGVNTVSVDISPSAVGYRLRIGPRPLPGISAFVRGSVIWIVLEQRHALDLSQLEARRREIGQVDAMVLETPVPATALRIAPPSRWDVAVLKDGETWVVEIGARPALPQRAIEPAIRANPDGSGGRVVVDMPGMQSLVRIRDPDGNDELIVVPTSSHGFAVASSRPFPDFRFLPAAQGVVLLPRSDRVQARLNGNLLELSGPQPIVGADTTVLDGSAATRRQELLDLRGWQRPRIPFDEVKQSLHRAVATMPPERRGPERLALAQFLLANGFALEALAQMRFLEVEAPRLSGLPSSRALRAAAAWLADDIEEAERSLAHPSLAINNEAALWSGLVKLRLEEFAAASELVTRGVEFAERYPSPVGPRVWLAIAQTQLGAGQTDSAVQFLDLAQRQPLTEPQRRHLALMRGMVLARQGDVEGAVRTWMPLETGGPSPTRAEATLARIETLLAADRMDRAAAVDALDRLRFAWRGDRTELRTLQLLARVHGEMGNFRAGLQVLRDAAAQFPDAREAREIANDMDLLFAKLFLDGEADKLPAVQAIGLFEEFRDRVPMGARGDAMVRRLVDRLIEVDLLDRAAALLEHQVRHRAAPAEKAELAARLALVQLLANRPEAALATLAETRDSPSSAAVRTQRNRIEARALAGAGRVQEGMSRLVGDEAPEALRLRVELLRQARDWAGVAASLSRLVGEPPSTGTPLPEARARDVLHYGTALGLAGDAAGMRALRERFGPAMDAGEYRDLFRVVTAETSERPGDMALVAQRINAVAPFQGFLQSYRRQVSGRAPAPG
jgi:predicted negative regulator of RcsB-dependent stress response